MPAIGHLEGGARTAGGACRLLWHLLQTLLALELAANVCHARKDNKRRAEPTKEADAEPTAGSTKR